MKATVGNETRVGGEEVIKVPPPIKQKNRLELLDDGEAEELSAKAFELLQERKIAEFNSMRSLPQGYPMWRPDFSGKSFKDMDLTGVNLNRANLKRTDFTNTNLTNADLWLANLTEAKLTGADLTNTKFNLATLDRADLQNADLSKTSITGASLQGVKLQGANLQTDLGNVKFTDAEFDAATKLPPPEEFLRINLDADKETHKVILPSTLPVAYYLRIQEIIRSKNTAESRLQEYK